MMNVKIYCLTFGLITYTNHLFSQKASELHKNPFRQIIFETNFSPVPLDTYFDPLSRRDKTFWELTLNGGVYTNINKHFLFGFSYSHLWTRFNTQNNKNYFVAGLEGRYNLALTNSINANFSTGYHVGNYCPCLNDVRNTKELLSRPLNKRRIIITFAKKGKKDEKSANNN
jgi:hypothetical protein